MIIRKFLNFPYPVLTQNNTGYINGNFVFDLDIDENVEYYGIKINYLINSDFLNKLINENKADIILIVQSIDNNFYHIKENFIKIPKTKLSLGKRTTFQLIIKSSCDIKFEKNSDIIDFYIKYIDDLVIDKNCILGYSNILVFDGSSEKPLQLFEKKIDPNLKSDIDIQLTNETILIVYKNLDYQFIDSPSSKTLNNIYIYMGLQKALYKFIINNRINDEESINLQRLDIPQNPLDLKLYNLMKKKMVQELSMDNIDSVIYLISDHILEKFVGGVRRLY